MTLIGLNLQYLSVGEKLLFIALLVDVSSLRSSVAPDLKVFEQLLREQAPLLQSRFTYPALLITPRVYLFTILQSIPQSFHPVSQSIFKLGNRLTAGLHFPDKNGGTGFLEYQVQFGGKFVLL